MQRRFYACKLQSLNAVVECGPDLPGLWCVKAGGVLMSKCHTQPSTLLSTPPLAT